MESAFGEPSAPMVRARASLLLAEEEVVWRFEVEVSRAALERSPEPDHHTDAACTAFGCATPVPKDARCAEALEAWCLPLHVGFQRLTVP